LAVVDGLRLHGYEIKSGRDSLRRLTQQVRLYSKVVDLATLVAAERHIDDAVAILPDWWGVVKVEAGTHGLRFKNLRRARNNPDRDPRALVELIWRDEALALLEGRGVAHGVRGKPRCLLWDRVCEHFGLEEIARTVRSHLKARATPELPALLS
jgi:hypothetical protein